MTLYKKGTKHPKGTKKKQKEVADSFGKAPTEEIRVIGEDEDIKPEDSMLVLEKKHKKALKKLRKRGPKKSKKKDKSSMGEKAVDNPEMKSREYKD